MPPGEIMDREDGGAEGCAAEVAWLVAGEHGD
jgi:hypothetical protein